MLLPSKTDDNHDETLVYPKDQRSKSGKLQDERPSLIKAWLTNPLVKDPDLDDKEFRKLVRAASHFFVTAEGRMYRRGIDSVHKLVVDQNQRMYLMKASHDSLGHRGFYATKTLVGKQF
jgi:hypothetical protein